MKYSVELLERAHKSCTGNKTELLASETCGCFYCLKVYSPHEITEWIEESNDTETAVCPHCDIDSVIASNSGFPIDDPAFLEEMCNYWFS